MRGAPLERSAAPLAANGLRELAPAKQVLEPARYEAFSLLDGDILVRNESYADPENREYRVRIEDGPLTSCDCPADANYSEAVLRVEFSHRPAVPVRIGISACEIQQRLVRPAEPCAASFTGDRG